MATKRWSQTKVDELIRRGVLALNDGYRVRNVELGKVGIPFVRGGDIGDGDISTSVEDHVLPEFADRVRSKLTQPYDVAFITKGTVGRVGLMRPGQPPSVFAPQVCYWRSLDRDQLDPRFLFYLLKSDEFQANLDAVKTHGSMAADYVSLSDQRHFSLTIPPPNDQKAIARILGTLDDKIELNRRMNATLEAMARALFQSWFVDFDPVRRNMEAQSCLTGRQAASNPIPDAAGRWFTYAIKCQDGSVYIGQTDNLRRRWAQHIDGKGAEWTKTHPPVALAFWETHDSLEAAVAREKWLKSGSGREWLKQEIAARSSVHLPAGEAGAKAAGRPLSGLDAPTAALFPASFQESQLGEIPAGWEVKSLDQIAQYLNGLALQKFPASDSETLSVVKIAQLRKGDTVGADRCSADIPVEYIIDDGDVLFSWSGSLEVELWCGGPGALNQHLFKVTSRDFPQWFYYHWTRHHLANFRLIAASKATTMGHIQRKHLTEAKVLIPSPTLIEALTPSIQPLLDQIVANRIQSRTLATLRDTLLPKLLSGELPVVPIKS